MEGKCIFSNEIARETAKNLLSRSSLTQTISALRLIVMPLVEPYEGTLGSTVSAGWGRVTRPSTRLQAPIHFSANGGHSVRWHASTAVARDGYTMHAPSLSQSLFASAVSFFQLRRLAIFLWRSAP